MGNNVTLNALVGNWHIDVNWGLKQFSDYLFNIDLIKSGAPLSIFDSQLESSKLITIITENGYMSTSDLSNITEQGSIVELTFNNVMRNEDGLCSTGVNSLVNTLYSLYSNPKVSGILLNLNSGGGESSSGYNLQTALLDRNKPVVVRTHFLGSAALNGAIGANEIIAASEAAEIGSIGSYIAVDMTFLTYLKDNMKYIYSKVSSDKNKSFRDLVDNDSTNLLEDEVTANAKVFQKMVSKYRNLNDKYAESTLQGGMFFARDAKTRGLVDAIGTRNYAIKRIKSLNKY